MPGFENLEQAIPMGEAQGELLAEDVRFPDEARWSDATALKVVLADIDAGIAFEHPDGAALSGSRPDVRIGRPVRWSLPMRGPLPLPLVPCGVPEAERDAGVGDRLVGIAGHVEGALLLASFKRVDCLRQFLAGDPGRRAEH